MTVDGMTDHQISAVLQINRCKYIETKNVTAIWQTANLPPSDPTAYTSLLQMHAQTTPKL